MSQFNVTLIFGADINVSVTAETPQEAAEIAYESDEAFPYLCHQCAGKLNLGDCIRAVVYDDNYNEVLDDGFDNEKILLLTKQRDDLLAELEHAAAYHRTHECYMEAKRVEAFIASVKGGA